MRPPWIGPDPTRTPPPHPMHVVGALEQARQLLDAGLAKGCAIDGPCYSIVAAVTASSRTTQIRDAALQAVRQALPGRWALGDIEAYNDWRDVGVAEAKALIWRAKTCVGTGVAA